MAGVAAQRETWLQAQASGLPVDRERTCFRRLPAMAVLPAAAKWEELSSFPASLSSTPTPLFSSCCRAVRDIWGLGGTAKTANSRGRAHCGLPDIPLAGEIVSPMGGPLSWYFPYTHKPYPPSLWSCGLSLPAGRAGRLPFSMMNWASCLGRLLPSVWETYCPGGGGREGPCPQEGGGRAGRAAFRRRRRKKVPKFLCPRAGACLPDSKTCLVVLAFSLGVSMLLSGLLLL